MNSVLFTWQGIHFYTLGTITILGILAGGVVVVLMARLENIRLESISNAILYITISSLIIGRVTYYLLFPDQLAGWWQGLYFWQDGVIAYASLLGGLVFSLWYFSHVYENPWRWLDILMIGFLIGWVAGQIGYFWAERSIGQIGQGVQAINEVGWLIIATGGLIGLWWKRYFSYGIIFWLGLIIWSSSRFWLGFWQPDLKAIANLSLNQIASLVIIAVSLLALYKMKIILQANIWEKLTFPITRRPLWQRWTKK